MPTKEELEEQLQALQSENAELLERLQEAGSDPEGEVITQLKQQIAKLEEDLQNVQAGGMAADPEYKSVFNHPVKGEQAVVLRDYRCECIHPANKIPPAVVKQVTSESEAKQRYLKDQGPKTGRLLVRVTEVQAS